MNASSRQLKRTLLLLMLTAIGIGSANAQEELPFGPPARVVSPLDAQRIPLPTVIENAPVDQQPASAFGSLQFKVRVKDITTIQDQRPELVSGIGLVVGLKGTGGSSQFTQDLAQNMLRNLGGVLTTAFPPGNVSVVAVTAEIPAFTKPGEEISATISVIDDAQGLYGGTLMPTVLKGIDGNDYALASGSVILSGFSAGGDAASVSVNHDTAGKVKARVEAAPNKGPAFASNSFRLLLTNKDLATANRITDEINRQFPRRARTIDNGSVEVIFPKQYRKWKPRFVEIVNSMRVAPDIPARVVINQKSGTIVIGQEVRISKILIADGNLVITTSENPFASQPAPFSGGETVTLPRTQINAAETGRDLALISQQATVGDLAGVLNALGVRPQKLISIFQSIKASGALQAQLVIE